jgi:hypothetical protein
MSGSHRIVRYPTRDELLIPRNRGLSAADRIRRNYVIEPSGCWRWTRGRTGSGYGHLSMQSVYYQAHLLVYILFRGPLPIGLEPDHLCRNRWCVNPNCIEFVTHAVNAQRGASARLTQGEADMIRAEVRAGISQRKVAKARGLDHSTVSRIMAGKLWPEAERQAVAA